jgi:excisionase family DNA binding protein
MKDKAYRLSTGLTSEQRLLKLLQASPEQQGEIDRILEGRVAPQPPAPSGPLLMRVKDAALLLGVHRTTMWRLVKAGRLETVELLGSLRVRRADIEALAGGHGAAGKAVAK